MVVPITKVKAESRFDLYANVNIAIYFYDIQLLDLYLIRFVRRHFALSHIE